MDTLPELNDPATAIAPVKKFPVGNIDWNKMPPGTQVEDAKTCFIAHLPNGDLSVICWEGRSSGTAQAALRAMAAKFRK